MSAIALSAAARLWFVVAVTGQLMLAAYVTLFYGRTALQGQVEAWDRFLTRGYVRGDAMGNTALIVHLVAAVVLIVSGALQFLDVPKIHRWVGRAYVAMAVATSIAGVYLTWVRGTRGDVPQHIGGTLNAVLILVCAFFVVRSAMLRRFTEHRQWTLRLFLLVSAAWFYRVGLFFWLFLNQRPIGFDPQTFVGPTLTFISFANSLVPLAVLELFFRAQAEADAAGRINMAAVLFVLTVAMGIGIYGATIGMWLPLLRTGQLQY